MLTPQKRRYKDTQLFSILKEITGNYSTLELVRFLALASVSFRRRAARKEFHLRGIESPMKKYVNMLYSMRLHINSDIILQHLPQHQPEDIESKKRHIEDALASIGKPIVVTIDDLD